MARVPLSVRDATADDLPSVLAFFDALYDVGPSRLFRVGRAALRSSAEQRYLAALDDPDARLVLAFTADGDGPSPRERLVGMSLLTVTPASPDFAAPSVHMADTFVAGHARRQGVGRALVATAADWASERGVDTVSVAVFAGARDPNRFFARLGFAPVAVRRAAPTAVLRRKLTGSRYPAVAARVPELPVRAGQAPARAAVARALAVRRRFGEG